MAENISFKSRVKNEAITYASRYKSYFVDKSYLIISDAFSNQPYYIIEAEESNYLHLVGVSTSLSAQGFYDKCVDGSLNEDDFELSFHGKDPKFSKGSIRQKILTLPYMFSIISSMSLVEEDFIKNVVRCSLASSNHSCTVGFISTPFARPMTLLKGNELDSSKAKPIKLALSKPRNAIEYSSILVGSDNSLLESYEVINPLISSDLKAHIEIIKAAQESEKQNANQNPETP